MHCVRLAVLAVLLAAVCPPASSAETVTVVAAALVVSPSPTLNAREPNGSELLRGCNAAIRQTEGVNVAVEESIRALHCLGYVSGFQDAMGMADWTVANVQACVPRKGIEVDQGVRILVKFLRENPERLNESGRILFFTAMVRAFPCKR
jgi:hypothetical protein